MKLLLDTQIYLWFLADSRRLSKRARGQIRDAREVFVSAASIWEIAIKVGLGKLDCDTSDVVDGIKGSGFVELPIVAMHGARVTKLPAHHRDPFDRLLIAQAICESTRLLTADATLTRYSDLVECV